MAAYVHRRKNENASYERIVQKLRDCALDSRSKKITRSEVERLADMELE